jgi:glutamate formiminotransferase / 5-formyltetrahydrofolate cyclo-ligase
MKTLLAEFNISEGADSVKINAIKDALMEKGDVTLIEVNSDKDHNRSVFTFYGEPEAVLESAKRIAKKAIELIDMSVHKGSHPRQGVLDVCPFIPMKDVTTEEAIAISKEFGKYLGSLGVPVFYYEDAATRPDRKNLVDIRRGEYEALPVKMQDPNWIPDEGPHEFNAKSGATVTGTRFPLIAFNVNLNTTNLEIGKKIVKAIRGAAGGYQCVRAMALEIPEKNAIQVSMNLTNYTKTPIHRVFETIKSEASAFGVSVIDTELVGPVPLLALEDVLKFYLRVHSLSMEQVH